MQREYNKLEVHGLNTQDLIGHAACRSCKPSYSNFLSVKLNITTLNLKGKVGVFKKRGRPFWEFGHDYTLGLVHGLLTLFLLISDAS